MVQLNYFGDSRDYFKYDLITTVLKDLKFKCYIFVPLLTEPRKNNDGKKQSYYDDGKSPQLLTFINECKCNGKSLAHWETWLKRYVNIYQTIKPVDTTYFYNHEREQYWIKFNPLLELEYSLLFIDPDTGIETGRLSKIKPNDKERYILSNEVERLIKTILPTSILMIYQHLQRNSPKREDDLIRKVDLLKNSIENTYVCAYREVDLSFIFISRAPVSYTENYTHA